MEQKTKKIEDFKLSLVKNIDDAINNGLDAEDIIGTLENMKMITFGLCRIDMPKEDEPNKIAGYR